MQTLDPSQRLGPRPSTQRELLFYLCFLLTLPLFMLAYALCASSWRCPSAAFAAANVETGAFLVGLACGPIGVAALFLCLACRFVRYPGRLVAFFGRNSALVLPPALGLLLAAGLCSFIQSRSYTCFGVDQVVSHNAFRADTLDGWSDLRVVTSACTHTGKQTTGWELFLEFAGGRTFRVFMSPAHRARMGEFRSAMARADYLYKADPTLKTLGCDTFVDGQRFR